MRGYAKLNTDRCSKKDMTLASTDRLLREEDRKWISGFIANVGQCDNLMVET